MKSLICALLLLVLITPAIAGYVEFTAIANDDRTVTISYEVTDGPIHGMALNIDSNIDVVSVFVDPYFDVFIDVAYADPDNYQLGDGTPIAGQNFAGEISLPSNSFCISMGHLEGVAISNEIILTFAESQSPASFVMDINTLRGGIVDDQGIVMASNLPIVGQIPEPMTLALLGLGGIFLRATKGVKE